MNFGAIFSILFLLGGLALGAQLLLPRPLVLLDPLAVGCVIGGTLLATTLTLGWKKLASLIHVTLKVILTKPFSSDPELVGFFIHHSGVARSHPEKLKTVLAPHPFCTDGLHIIADGKISSEEFKEILRQRLQHYKSTFDEDSRLVRGLAKYPPGMGLVASLFLLLAALARWGSGDVDTCSALVLSAFVSTFWGLMGSYLFLLPLSDRLHRLAQQDIHQRNIMAEGLWLLKHQASEELIREKLASYMLAHRRKPLATRPSTEHPRDRRVA